MSESTLHEINLRGIEGLKKVLDPLELVRFFQQYEIGSGNYTEERRNTFKHYTIQDISKEIKEKKRNQKKDKKARQ
jgi:hypothetical protein